MNNNTWQLLENAILETLEDRRMMSASPLPAATLVNGVVTANGDSTAASRVVVDYGITKSVLVVDNDGTRATFPVSDVKQLDITMGSGSDYVYINPAIDIPADVQAGNGNDTIRTGAGDDTIIAGNGVDVIYGKQGNNDITVGSGNDLVRGGSGNDLISVGDGNDYIAGGGGTDVMNAGNGNDTFLAGASHDSITAGTGQDVVVGGSGNQFVQSTSATTTGGTGTTTTGGTGTTTTGGTGTTTTGGTGTTTTGGTGTTTTGGTGTTTTGGTGTTSTGGTGTTTTGGTGTTTTGGTGTTTTTGGTSSSATGAGTGGTSTSTTGVSTDDVGTSDTYGWETATGKTPSAVISTLAGSRFTGNVVNVSALDSTLGAGTPIDTTFAWDFGDTKGAHDQITGYNGAHVYDTPGTYTVTLTMTNMNGVTSTASQQITIAASQRTQIYVDSVNGLDTNNGSINSPLQSASAAFAKLADNTEILLRAGESFDVTATLDVKNANVLIGRYGTGANPVFLRQLGGGAGTIALGGTANGVTVQDITFDSPFTVVAGTTPNKVGVSGIYVGGSNVAIRDCTFLNIDDAVNENSNPVGVLVQDNDAPLSYGVRGYFLWAQGSEQVIIGNTVANSSREHNMRLVDVSEITIENNILHNDDGKGCIECHLGNFEWIQGNSCTDGDIRVGPLGLWGEDPASSTDFSVIVDNQLTDTFIFVQPGAHHSVIANNVITDASGAAIRLSGVDSDGRTSSDITILNNTAIDSGTQGNFLNLGGYVNGIVMKNNLFIAPNLVIGSYGTTPVYVDDADLSSFTEIGNNIWPAPDTVGTYAGGGINLVGTSYNTANFLTAAGWNAQSEVQNDVFETLSLGNSYQMTAGGVTAGSTLAMAA